VISVNEQAKNQKLQNCSNELVHFISVLHHQKWSDHYHIWQICSWHVRAATQIFPRI